MLDNKNDLLDEDDGIIELKDQNGNIERFELVDSAEYNGTVYHALIPENSDEPEEFVVLKESGSEGDEIVLITIDDDDEYNEVGEMFLKRFSELLDDEDEDNGDGEDKITLQ